MKRVLSLGISDPKVRLAAWCGSCAASSVLLFVWWPLGGIPFLILLVLALRSAREVL